MVEGPLHPYIKIKLPSLFWFISIYGNIVEFVVVGSTPFGVVLEGDVAATMDVLVVCHRVARVVCVSLLQQGDPFQSNIH